MKNIIIKKDKKPIDNNIYINKNRGIIEETPPTISPDFVNSGSIITDNEYEVTSEINNININKKDNNNIKRSQLQ